MGRTTTHSQERLDWIQREMQSIGVSDYRFCIENDCYVCDSCGIFYSVCKRQYSKTGNFIEHYRIQRLRGSEDRYGYLTYRITVEGVKKHLKGHRMVLNAWAGAHADMSVNHKDGNKHNNAMSNLEWCTVAENNAHAIETGLLDPHGAKMFHYAVPLCDWVSIFILNVHCGYSYSELGRMYRCTHETIKRIVDRIGRVVPKEVVNG